MTSRYGRTSVEIGARVEELRHAPGLALLNYVGNHDR
jgi:hypothetical protein